MGFVGWLFAGFLAFFAALGGIGFLQKKRAAGKKDKEPLSDRDVENVLDLNDRFNRARYMDHDKE